MRVLRVYHSAVVAEYREREVHLRNDYGHELRLVCPPRWSEGGRTVNAESGSVFPVDVVRVHGRTRHPILFWFDRRALRAVLREFQPHIVDLHEEPYSLAVAAALGPIREEVPRAKIAIYTAQNVLRRYPRPFRDFEKRAFKAATAMYPCSTEAGDVLRRKGYRGPLHVIPLGTTVYEPAAASDGHLRVGFAGRLETYKGVDVALSAFAQASAGRRMSFEVLGDGPRRADLERLVATLGVEAQVHLRGAVSQDEALARLATLDVLLVPSIATPTWKEQFGRVAAQAMASGTVVIASASGSLPEVVGDAGAIVPEGDVTALAKALAHLADDHETRAELSRRSAARARRLFAWPAVASDFDRMYNDMANAHTHSRSYVQ